MAQQTVNLGTVANDGTGDTLRAGGDKINDNFDELYAANSALAETIRDTIGAALVAGTNVTITVNDAGDTITVAKPYRGAHVTKSADETTANYGTAPHIVEYDTEEHDTDSIHNFAATVTITIASPGVVTWTGHNFLAGTPLRLTTTGALPTGLTASTTYYVINPAANTFQLAATKGGAAINTTGSQSGVHTATNYSRLLVPAGVTKVEVGYNTLLSSVTANTVLQQQVLKNGSGSYTGNPATGDTSADTSPRWGMTSGPLTVVAGDYFEHELGTGADTSITVAAGYSSFWMKILG